MHFEYSKHWMKKKEGRRQDIEEHMIEYCLMKSNRIKDRRWGDVYNAITRIPPSARLLKVVYKIEGKNIKILTAYWL